MVDVLGIPVYVGRKTAAEPIPRRDQLDDV